MGKFDVPLALASKQYQENGTLVSPAGIVDELFGDIIHV
jgi:bilirubin oxidase